MSYSLEQPQPYRKMAVGKDMAPQSAEGVTWRRLNLLGMIENLIFSPTEMGGGFPERL